MSSAPQAGRASSGAMTGVEAASSADQVKQTIYVWELPVRITHWVNVLSILTLSLTGYYISNPFFGTTGIAANEYLMGTIRFIHFAVAFVFTVSVLFRLYWAFAGNRYARWTQFAPVGRGRRRALGRMLGYYTFLRREPPAEIGHNPLAGLTYVGIYVLFVLQIVTGFALYSLPASGGFWKFAFGWIIVWFGAPYVRLAHDLIMFLLIAFTIHHVYSAVLIDIEERSGLVSSIVTGYKTLSRRHIAEAQAETEGAPSPRRPFWSRFQRGGRSNA
ncbi:MAG TPA: Ni/Fe-hydrogenase, b-type cytochrome subunit [Ktedonobacterales bacterium]|jgi:Ni/Fe-hydrogenase 1 B-type cytochrome subunit